MNEESLVMVAHDAAMITSLLLVHTARQILRFGALVEELGELVLVLA